jgi:hypothetical protein
MLLIAVPLLFLEQQANLRKTLAIFAIGALLSFSTALIFGLSDVGRYLSLIEFFALALFLPKPVVEQSPPG